VSLVAGISPGGSGSDTNPERKQRILIAGASCRAAAQCAARSGFYPIALDDFVDRDLIECASAYPLAAIETWGVVQPFLPGLKCLLAGGIENRPEILQRLIDSGARCGIDVPMLRQLRDPLQWQSWATKCGLNFPETLWHPIGGGIGNPIGTADSDRKWLCKSLSSAGGLGVQFCDDSTHCFEGSGASNVYWQRFVNGRPIGITFLSAAGRSQFVGAALSIGGQRDCSPLPFLYRGNIAPLEIRDAERERLEGFAHAVHQSTGIRGLWQADWIVNHEGWWLLEINPRWSASMELLDPLYGNRLIANHVEALGDTPAFVTLPCIPETLFLGKLVLYATRDYQPSHSDLEWMWSRRWNGSSNLPSESEGLADIPNTEALIPCGYPVLTCLVGTQRWEDVSRALERITLEVRRKLGI
jgi:predicted ATP-grasp superfamily ATP-dependent carboligase